MASVCGSTLALMDAGVPLKAPVAGIAMGLIKEGDDFAVLSDILGDEDHLGDMDFKVAGTEQGITSLQMDIKVAGITREIMEKALDQAKAGRAHILAEMTKALGSARSGVSSALVISPRMCARPAFACSSALVMISCVMPATLMSIWSEVMPFSEPATLKSMSPR